MRRSIRMTPPTPARSAPSPPTPSRTIGNITGGVIVLLALGTSASAVFSSEKHGTLHTENIVIVTLDGLRWQELFHGADETLLDKTAGGVRDLDGLKSRYWRASAEE